ncbi:MAG: nuclear transport factor 2 family protein [Frankia sp.]
MSVDQGEDSEARPDPSASQASADRPALHRPASAGEAEEAVRELIERLQAGLDRGDADEYDSMFAADLLWGSPYGAVLAGFEPLNAIHHRLMENPTVSPSRYEVVQTLAPARDVVITQVRRRSGPDGPDSGPTGFSEMAMYVLIRRDGRWWLAGGQNTVIAAPPSTPAGT